MQRKRSNVYSAGPSVSHPRHSALGSDPENYDPRLGVFGKYPEKGYFSDLRVEIDRELASKHTVHPGYLRSKASIVRSSLSSKATTRAKPVSSGAYESSVPTPSSTRQMPRRCQSASAVRKKLFHAVEQGSSSGGHQHPNHKLQAQIEALRNLASAPLSKTLTRTNSGYRAPSTDTSCYGKPPRTTSTGKTQNQDEIITGVRLGPSRSASVSILMANPAQTSTPSYPNTAASILVGGYRSSSVQLEVELVERLNEIGRSNLPEKTLSRTRACQNVLDSIVAQDEHYGRLLSRIRDEFSTYVDMISRKSPIKSNNTKGAAKTWCACGQDVFELALLKQENTVMKKRVSGMQHEIESLQAALRQATSSNGIERSNGESIRDTSSTGSWTDDDQDALDDVQLFPVEEMHEQHSKPQDVPFLSFASLPSYSDEEEDEEGFTQ